MARRKKTSDSEGAKRGRKPWGHPFKPRANDDDAAPESDAAMEEHRPPRAAQATVGPGPLDALWWRHPENEAHRPIWDVVQSLQQQQQDWTESALRWLSEYMDQDLTSTGTGSQLFTARVRTTRRRRKNPIRFNILHNLIQTRMSRICASPLRAMFLTDGAEWSQRKQARLLQKWVDGLFSENKFQTGVLPRVFQDKDTVGIGWVKWFVRNERLRCSRVFPLEVVYDENACAHGASPRALYHVQSLSADAVIAHYAESAEDRTAIEKAIGDCEEMHGSQMMRMHDVQVVEAWHLPSAPSSEDGRHVICIEGYTLLDEDWPLDCFPLVPYTGVPLPVGFRGRSIMDAKSAAQQEFNDLMRRIQDSMNLHATRNTYYEDGSIDPKHLRNDPGNYIPVRKGTMQMPKADVGPSMPSDVYAHTKDIRVLIHEDEGVSQMSASSAKPPGITAAVAMQQLRDIEGGRFQLETKIYEMFAMQNVEVGLEMMRHHFGDKKERRSYKVFYQAKDFVKRIDWKDIDLERDATLLKMMPASTLPQEPAGRLEMVDRLMQIGIITQEMAPTMMDWPDLERFFSLWSAAIDDIDAQIEELLDGGEAVPEEEQAPYLVEGIKRMASARIRAKLAGAPQEILDGFSGWIAGANEIVARSVAPPPMPMMPPGAPPMMPPGMVPPPMMPGQTNSAEMPMPTPMEPPGMPGMMG